MMSSLFRKTVSLVAPIRAIYTSSPRLGDDRRDKMIGHISKKDTAEGERMPMNHIQRNAAVELIDENLFDSIHDNTKFSQLPVMHVKCTRNNTKISLTSGNGRVLAVKSCGTEGYKNCRKGTTVAAQAVARRVLIEANDNNIKTVRLVLHGLGPGRNAAVKCLELSDLNVVSITDRTPAQEPWNARPRAAKSL